MTKKWFYSSKSSHCTPPGVPFTSGFRLTLGRFVNQNHFCLGNILKLLTLKNIKICGMQTKQFIKGISKSHLININPILVKMGLWITRLLFHLYGSEAISGTENKYYNKRCSHCFYFSGNYKSFGSCELWTVAGRLKYVFIVNHNIFNYFALSSKLIHGLCEKS